MVIDSYQSLGWGVQSDRASSDFATTFGGRLPSDHHVVADEESDGDRWNLWDGFDGVEHGVEHFEGDPAAHWLVVPVALTTCRFADFPDQSYGADNARDAWEVFRAHCLREADYDPGEGELLVVVSRR